MNEQLPYHVVTEERKECTSFAEVKLQDEPVVVEDGVVEELALHAGMMRALEFRWEFEKVLIAMAMRAKVGRGMEGELIQGWESLEESLSRVFQEVLTKKTKRKGMRNRGMLETATATVSRIMASYLDNP